MVLTRRTIDHQISSQSRLEEADVAKILEGDNGQTQATGQPKGLVDSNYDDPSLEVGEHDSETVRQLKLQNKALFQLLKNQLKTAASSRTNDEEDDTAASSTKLPQPHAAKPTSKGKGALHAAPSKTQTRFAEKSQGIPIAVPEDSEAPRVSVFNRLTDKSSAPKVWAEDDLRRLIDKAVTGRTAAQTPRELAKIFGSAKRIAIHTESGGCPTSEEVLSAEVHRIRRKVRPSGSYTELSAGHGVLGL